MPRKNAVDGKPNIILITCDQLRKDALGCYGNPVVQTPNIDRLASRGVRFERIFTALPTCAPNRASLATGRYPSINGLSENGRSLPLSEVTLMQALRDSGYSTYGVGKMHFEPQWNFPPDGSPLKDPGPELAENPQPDQTPWYGFDKVWITEDHRVGPYADYLRAHGLDPWADPHSFTYPQHQCVRSAYPAKHHQTHWIADRSIEFLNEHQAGDPFFMWVSFVDPHHPFNPPAPYDTMYDPEEMPLPVWDESEVDGWPEFVRRKYSAVEGGHEAIGMCHIKDAEWQRIKAYYYGMVTFIDDQIGRIEEALSARGMLDNTIFVFTADHGELLGDHHLVFKGPHYDCVTNMPLFVTRPGETAAGESRRQIGNCIDVMPTILDLAAVDVPAGVQGRSLVPVLEDNELTHYEATLIEMNPFRTIWTEDARLTWHGAGLRGELYDHRRDPNCFHNLWDDPAAVDLKQRLMGQLIGLMVQNTDPLPVRTGAC